MQREQGLIRVGIRILQDNLTALKPLLLEGQKKGASGKKVRPNRWKSTLQKRDLR